MTSSTKKPIKIKRPGALTKKAQKSGMSINKFARKHKNDKGLTGIQSRLYLNVFKPAAAKRKKKR